MVSFLNIQIRQVDNGYIVHVSTFGHVRERVVEGKELPAALEVTDQLAREIVAEEAKLTAL
jgi:hypothetical protein